MNRLPMIAVLIVFMLIFALNDSYADSFEVHAASKHFGSDRDYNEVNPGLGYTKTFEGKNLYLTGGAYYGSERSPIGYFAYGGEFGSRAFRGGVEIGALVGYSLMTVAPMVAPYFSYGTNHTRLKMRILPLVEPIGLVGTILTLSVEFKM